MEFIKILIILLMFLMGGSTLIGCSDVTQNNDSLFAAGLEHILSDGKGTPRYLQHVLINSCLKRLRRRSSFIPDMGYDSRVYSVSKFVRALLAYHDVFGMYGPGRKK